MAVHPIRRRGKVVGGLDGQRFGQFCEKERWDILVG